MDKPHIIFTCLGNICRSPMAELILKQLRPDLVSRITSAAMTDNTAGKEMNSGAITCLWGRGIACDPYRKAIHYDDLAPRTGIEIRIDLADVISDPYHAGDFERTYEEIIELLRESGLIKGYSTKYLN